MFTLAVAALLASAPSPLARFTIDGEVGPGYVVQNDNRYGASGTKYTAREVGQQRNLFIARRLSVEALFGERHTVVMLYAPLDLTTRVTLGRDIDFRGTVFSSGEVVDHRYLFDGYRASYLFGALRRETVRLDVGTSIQIRNASVELRTVDSASPRFGVEHDIGTVFALKARLTYRPRENFWARLEADGISSFGVFRSFSGGLYDVSLTAGTPVGPTDLFLRLRWLGGGANVTTRNLDNWGSFFFATAGVRLDVNDLMSPRAEH